MTDIITAPVTPQPAPPRRHRVRTGLIITAAAFGAFGIIGALAGQGTAPAARPATHSAPATQPAAPVTAPASPDLAGWYLAGGYTELSAVSGDLSQAEADANAYDIGALKADGQLLAADAATAQADPPPVDSGDYIAAMGDLASAGRALAAGDITGATADLNVGAELINRVTAAIPSSAS